MIHKLDQFRYLYLYKVCCFTDILPVGINTISEPKQTPFHTDGRQSKEDGAKHLSPVCLMKTGTAKTALCSIVTTLQASQLYSLFVWLDACGSRLAPEQSVHTTMRYHRRLTLFSAWFGRMSYFLDHKHEAFADAFADI